MQIFAPCISPLTDNLDYGIKALNWSPTRTKIYPNPAFNYIIVEYYLNENIKNADLSVIDLKGRIIYEKKVDEKHGFVKFDITSFREGLYICRLISDKKSVSGKFIKE